MSDSPDKPSNVLPFYKPVTGEPAFMVCPCQPDGVPFLVIVASHETHPVICRLVCPECDVTYSVINGVVQYE